MDLFEYAVSLRFPGVETEETQPWQENGEAWRRLKVTFSASIATHSAEQTFYFDQHGLLKRHDYDVDISGGTSAAHYVSELKELWNCRVDKTHDVWTSAGWEISADAAGGFDRHSRGRI